MDRVFDGLATEFPPGWFDNMEFASDWVAVMALFVSLAAAYFAWKALGPRRKAKIRFTLSDQTYVGPQGNGGYRQLFVINDGYFLANDLVLGIAGDFKSTRCAVGDLDPREMKEVDIALRNYEGRKLLVIYKDENNKKTRTKVRIPHGNVNAKRVDEQYFRLWSSRG